MINVKIETKGDDLVKYVENLQTNFPLVQIAEAIRKDIERNLTMGESYDGSSIASLKASTIKRKGHGVVFTETGQLKRSIKKQRIDKNRYEIFINPNRKGGGDNSKIMEYLQRGDSPLAGARRAFGISKKVIELINDLTQKFLKRAK